MPKRPTPLRNNYVYHIFNRGVAKQKIFLDDADYRRFIEALDYYRFPDQVRALSAYRQMQTTSSQAFKLEHSKIKPTIEILAFCLMPNHFHLMVRQIEEGGISTSIANLTNSYTRSFNTRYERVGPLFQGPFKSVWVETDEQLSHLSRYIHINPVVGQLTQKPEDYPWSSYRTYFDENDHYRGLCDPGFVLDLFAHPTAYRNFVADHLDYARSLEIIKHALID